MSIVTRTGDSGMTGLFGGKRVSKASLRLHAYGTVDELNAVLGFVLARGLLSEELRGNILRIQHTLFRLGGDLATPLDVPSKVDRMSAEHAAEVEGWIHAIEADLPLQTQFLLPGGSLAGAELHLARTVCRRAERWISALCKEETINPAVRTYVNRLGDFLFVAARRATLDAGEKEVPVQYELPPASRQTELRRRRSRIAPPSRKVPAQRRSRN